MLLNEPLASYLLIHFSFTRLQADKDAIKAMLVTDTSILHHAFISIFIALWAVITHYVTILMPFLSYFIRFNEEGECRQLEF